MVDEITLIKEILGDLTGVGIWGVIQRSATKRIGRKECLKLTSTNTYLTGTNNMNDNETLDTQPLYCSTSFQVPELGTAGE